MRPRGSEIEHATLVYGATAGIYDVGCCFLTPGVTAANIDFCPQKALIEKRSKLSSSGTFLVIPIRSQ